MIVTPHYSSKETLQFTYDCAKMLLNTDGVFVECGVASGSQIGAMAECLKDNNQVRTIYGFDSFQGIPFAGEYDLDQPGIGAKDESKLGLLESSGISSHSKQEVLNNFKRWGLSTDNLKLIEGWFENTIPGFEIEPIALLRLDGDLYSSTKVCMEHLFPKMVSGGILIIDDYLLPGSRKAINEFIPHNKIIEHLGIAYYEVP
jgi:hypothetical protein